MRQIALALGYLGAITAIYFFQDNVPMFGQAANIINMLTFMLALAWGYEALDFFGTSSRQGRSTFLMMTGLIGWLTADIIWMTSSYQIVSIADVFYFGGYLALFAGIILGLKNVLPEVFKKRDLVVLSSTFIIISLAYYILFSGRAAASSQWEIITTYGYLLLDLFLISLCLLIFLTVLQGTYSRAWMAFGTGALLVWMADLYYALNPLNYAGGDMINIVWYAGYIAFGIGFILQKKNAQRTLEMIILDEQQHP